MRKSPARLGSSLEAPKLSCCGCLSHTRLEQSFSTLSWSVFKSCGQSQLFKYREIALNEFRSQSTESHSAFPIDFPHQQAHDQSCGDDTGSQSWSDFGILTDMEKRIPWKSSCWNRVKHCGRIEPFDGEAHLYVHHTKPAAVFQGSQSIKLRASGPAHSGFAALAIALALRLLQETSFGQTLMVVGSAPVLLLLLLFSKPGAHGLVAGLATGGPTGPPGI